MKPRMNGLTYASLSLLVYNMIQAGKQEITLGVICPEREEDKTLIQYLTILDQLGTISTYKEMLSTEGKFQGYIFTIKLKL
jgi:hypothetical protein